MAGTALISMGCSSHSAVEDTRSQELASEEDDPICVSASAGDGSSCIDYADLKMQIHALCEADGRVLTDLSNMVECPGGGGVVQADYVCCAPAPVDPNQDPGPDPSGCVYSVLGDGTTCETPEALKAQASSVCAAEGLVVLDLSGTNDCPNGGSTYAKLACCPEPDPNNPPPDPNNPPPDPVVCSYHVLGDGTVCAAEDAWTDQAEAVCAAEGSSLTDFGFAADCADGTSSYAKFTCCEP
jgi:hypothetical protein